jgi:hypothetical protein
MAPDKDLHRLAMVGALVFLVASSVGGGGIEVWDWQAVALSPWDAAHRRQN